MSDLEGLAGPARKAATALGAMPSERKAAALEAMADGLVVRTPEILDANSGDVARSAKEHVTEAVTDRLRLDEDRIRQIADGVRQVAALPDPVGEVIEDRVLPNGLRVEKIRVPLGVVGVIYEGRPNVTVDAASLAVRAGNAVLLRGSRIAERSNVVLTGVIQEAGETAGLPDRKSVV